MSTEVKQKYLAKEVVTASPTLKIYKYYYESGCRIYIVPKNEAENVVSVWVKYLAKGEMPVIDQFKKTIW